MGSSASKTHPDARRPISRPAAFYRKSGTPIRQNARREYQIHSQESADRLLCVTRFCSDSEFILLILRSPSFFIRASCPAFSIPSVPEIDHKGFGRIHVESLIVIYDFQGYFFIEIIHNVYDPISLSQHN